MDFLKNKSKIFKTPVIARHSGITSFDKKKISNIVYNKGDDLYFGVILKTPYISNTEYYSIATGKIIEKEGIHYYEVYPDMYTYDQMEIVNAALRTMRWSDAPEGTSYN